MPMADDPNEPVELYRARGAHAAHALRALLEAAGVPARVDGELLGGIAGEVPFGWVTAPRVLVPRGQVAAAAPVLAEFLDRAGPPDGADAADGELRCLACRAPMGDADACPACGWSYAGAPDDPAGAGR